MQERVGRFLGGLASRKEDVRRRCRTVLQSRAEALPRNFHPDYQPPSNEHPTLALEPVSEVRDHSEKRNRGGFAVRMLVPDSSNIQL